MVSKTFTAVSNQKILDFSATAARQSRQFQKFVLIITLSRDREEAGTYTETTEAEIDTAAEAEAAVGGETTIEAEIDTAAEVDAETGAEAEAK